MTNRILPTLLLATTIAGAAAAPAKHAYGFARGHANKHGWVAVADLCK